MINALDQYYAQRGPYVYIEFVWGDIASWSLGDLIGPSVCPSTHPKPNQMKTHPTRKRRLHRLPRPHRLRTRERHGGARRFGAAGRGGARLAGVCAADEGIFGVCFVFVLCLCVGGGDRSIASWMTYIQIDTPHIYVCTGERDGVAGADRGGPGQGGAEPCSQGGAALVGCW